MHVPTLFLLNVVLCALVAATLTFTAGRRTSELYVWAAALAVHAAGYGLGGLRGQIPDMWSIVGGNTLLAASVSILAEGVYRFHRRPAPRLLLWLPVPVTAVVFAVFIHDMAARLLWGGLLLIGQLVFVLWPLWTQHRRVAGSGQFALMFGFLLALGCLAARLVYVLGGNVPVSLFDASPLYSLIFFGNLLALMLITIGMILMVHERTQQELINSEGQYRRLIESAQEGVCILDTNRCSFANSRMAELLGIPIDYLVGHSFLDFVHPDDRAALMTQGNAPPPQVDRPPAHDIRLLTAHSGIRWFRSSAVGIQWNGLPATMLLLMDIHERKLNEEKTRELAFHDELTRLPNRRLLTDRLKQALALLSGDEHVALMFIDLDKFKDLNDQHGHPTGDRVLVEVANRLLRQVRERDTVARLGGDEFVVLVRELHKDYNRAHQQARRVGEKILGALAEPYPFLSTPCSASIGIHLFNQPVDAIDNLLNRADSAMYQAKQTSRGTIAFS